jgi:hypothetical protein
MLSPAIRSRPSTHARNTCEIKSAPSSPIFDRQNLDTLDQ